VVTASGQHLIASPEKYSDLFWALSGGGGGTFAVVMSVTVKAHPEVSTASATLTFSGAGVAADTFWSIVRNFVVGITPMVGVGAVAIWAVIGRTFSLTPISWPGGTVDQLHSSLTSTLALLNQSNIKYGTYP
jgi:FAD/FMN-containing dehydrogenase